MQARALAAGKGKAMAALLALLLAPGCAPQRPASQSADGRALRVVSMNPCVDAILREVADDGQIAAISHYSQDPRATSVPLDWARRFAVVGDEAEDVVALAPDLVITGPHVAPQTAAALERMGIDIMMLPVPATVAESEAQINEVARALSHEARARALNARIDAAVTAARGMRTERAPSALIWQDGGLVPGRGTLADELLLRAGFRSASAERGLPQWEMLSLEELLWSPPDIVMTGRAGMRTDSGASSERAARHPALDEAGRRMMIASFPSDLLHCGGPVIIRTVGRLAQIRRQWQAERGS